MQIFGHQTSPNSYIGRSTNAGMFDTNSLNSDVSSSVEQSQDSFVMRDTDANPNLKVKVDNNPVVGPRLLVVNSDESNSPNGAEHVVQAAFPLTNMAPETAAQLANEDLTRNGAADYISVKGGDGVYTVEVGEFGPGKIHNGFMISDGPPARMRGGPPMPPGFDPNNPSGCWDPRQFNK